MTSNTRWLLPRTRVGLVGAVAAFGCIVMALLGVAKGWLMLAVLATVGVVGTAVLRHGDHSLVLWVLGTVGLGWLLLTLLG